MRSASLNVTWTSWLVDVAPVAVASGDAVGAGTVAAADAIGLVSAGAGVDAVARGDGAGLANVDGGAVQAACATVSAASDASHVNRAHPLMERPPIADRRPRALPANDQAGRTRK